MSVRRVMGTETEYAVSSPDGKPYNPVRLSFDVVGAAATSETKHVRWDYRQEDPVNDARGIRMERAAVHPDILTDAPQLNITNVIAPNGGRIYVDHAHPEYSAPETCDPFEAVRYDHAGDLIMLQAARKASEQTGRPIELHRNNVDGKGASWGTHENYMMLRRIPFDDVTKLMIAHFATRQIYTGSGRVGIGEHSEQAGFQLSQRADYFHMKVGLQTTFDRPIINTRDESHATTDQRRLHVIVGDANRMDTPQILKLGVTSMLLWLLEHADNAGIDLNELWPRIMPADPVEAMHTVSHDLTLGAQFPLENGTTATAWSIQVNLRAAVYAAAAIIYGTNTQGEPAWPDRSTSNIMAMWGQALVDIAAIRHADDDTRLGLTTEASRVEWLLKWQLMERLRRKTGCAWNDARIRALDLSWAALDPAKSVWERLRAGTERAIGDVETRKAMTEAPADTRAWTRADFVKRFASDIVAVSWTHITVRDERSRDGMLTLDMPDPLAFTRQMGAYADAHDAVEALRILGA